MKITINMVQDLLDMMKKGLCNGAGTGSRFCVQQAVNRAVNKLGSGHIDSVEDGAWCLNSIVRNLGIQLNDCNLWDSNQDRAECLQRFAVAEMGSSVFADKEFTDKMVDKLGRDWNIFRDRSGAIRVADTAAEVLTEMGTEGSKFLKFLDEPNKAKAKAGAEVMGLQIYAAQMADMRRQIAKSPYHRAQQQQ